MTGSIPCAAVLFDLDGTLVDTAPDLIHATNLLRERHGLPALPDNQVRAEVSMGGRALTRLALGEAADDLALEQLLADYAACLGEHSQIFAGLEPLLAHLRLHHQPWGIVTNKERRFAEPLLAALSLEPPTLVCGDDVAKAKPHPEALIAAAAELEVTPEQCCYIGDHRRDMDAAHASGMCAIAVGYGYLSPTDDIRDWNADRRCDTPAQLSALLTTQLKQRYSGNASVNASACWAESST
ncbi:N-acetylmuramic acid 6-phosphate phosphatase [Carnimonas sp. R-84981]|uniref:HAD family hydrolase n=1 Tax=Carnimonas bestiolae TaxID=3402172 RepID=UPI003EDBAD97